VLLIVIYFFSFFRTDMEDDFDFDTFAESFGLSKATCAILYKKDLTSPSQLANLDDTKIQRLKLSKRQESFLALGVKNVQPHYRRKNKGKAHDRSSAPAVGTPYISEEAELDGQLQSLIIDNDCDDGNGDKEVDTSPAVAHALFDPRAILILKSQSRAAVHITEFLPNEVKRRRALKGHRAGEYSSDQGPTRSEDASYVGISIDEWGAANGRLLNYLLSSGNLVRADVEYYLAYTTQIFDFAAKYTWASILAFDH
jgi:hypothetical protein